MAIECRTFSLDKAVDGNLSKVAERFSMKKSQIVNELLKQMLPGLIQGNAFTIREAMTTAVDILQASAGMEAKIDELVASHLGTSKASPIEAMPSA